MPSIRPPTPARSKYNCTAPAARRETRATGATADRLSTIIQIPHSAPRSRCCFSAYHSTGRSYLPTTTPHTHPTTHTSHTQHPTLPYPTTPTFHPAHPTPPPPAWTHLLGNSGVAAVSVTFTFLPFTAGFLKRTASL